ncbi:carbohydrate ABC transporter permease [Nonomuraea sediminis]|uniref:carbohydrate ABC transporter permease n=1 Tax=Nonomuraea sediminis TaxID=2835864 RepID=UPI001BDD4BFD|nr:carbohydrate ABC transporter permease [Nonomuraea sediminis]
MKRALVYATLALTAVAMAWPFLWMVRTSLRTPADVWTPGWLPQTFDAYGRVFTELPFGRFLLNSSIVTAAVVLLNVVFDTAAAYAFAKLRFRGRTALFWLLLITLMVPFQVNLVPLYRLMVELHATDTYFGLIAPSAVQVFGVFLMRQYLQSIPDAVLESARLDGARELQILRKIVFPVARPAMAALAIFTFLGAWNDFLWPLIVTDSEQMRTLPVGLALLARKNSVSWTDSMAGAVITILPMVAFFAVLQRRFVEGLTAGAVKDG